MTKRDAVSSYKVPVDERDGMLFPVLKRPKTVSRWTPIRHGVLLNEFMRWHNKGCGDVKDFSEFLHEKVKSGNVPLLEIYPLDINKTKFTPDAFTSQIEWMAQRENQVIIWGGLATEFIPNNLMIMTSYQKAGESLKAQGKEDLVPDEERSYLANLAGQLKALTPKQRELLSYLCKK